MKTIYDYYKKPDSLNALTFNLTDEIPVGTLKKLQDNPLRLKELTIFTPELFYGSLNFKGAHFPELKKILRDSAETLEKLSVVLNASEICNLQALFSNKEIIQFPNLLKFKLSLDEHRVRDYKLDITKIAPNLDSLSVSSHGISCYWWQSVNNIVNSMKLNKLDLQFTDMSPKDEAYLTESLKDANIETISLNQQSFDKSENKVTSDKQSIARIKFFETHEPLFNMETSKENSMRLTTK